MGGECFNTVSGVFLICILRYWGEGELDALGFTTKFRNSISKALLCPPHLYGSVAVPCLAESTHLPVSAQAHLQRQVGKACPQSHREVEKIFLPPYIPSPQCWAPRELELSPALLERPGWRIWIKQTFVWPGPNHESFFINTCHLQGKVQCQSIEGSHYSLEIFVNPLNRIGTLLTSNFLFPHLSDYFSVLFPFIKSS